MMDERMKREQMFGGVAEAMENKRYSFKEAIELYYGEPKLTEEEEKVVDEMLKEIEESGFLEKCKEIVREKERERERKIIHIGRLKISRVAGLIFLVCFISVFGVTAYAAVMSHIRGIEVNEMGDHSEVAVEYNPEKYNPENEEELSAIETYYKPVWVPDGYHLDSEEKYADKYRLLYISDTGEDQIVYYQTLPSVKVHYSTEDGLSEKVVFGQYSGEYIETDLSNYLIVTDGTYIYSLIADTAGKKELIKMIQ